MSDAAPGHVARVGAMPGVIFLIHDLRRGGAERVFLSLVRWLGSVRVVPVLVRRTIEVTDGVDAGRILDLAGPAYVRRVAGVRHVTAVVTLGRCCLELRAVARRHEARVISSFLHKSHIIALLTKLTLDRRLRVVVNVHELQSQHLQHHFTGADRSAMRWLLRRLLPRADLIITVADGVRTDLSENFGVDAAKVVTVHNAIDAAFIRSRAREPLDDAYGPALADRTAPLIVCVGRLVPLKGHADLLHAFSRMQTSGARLVIIGEGPERERLERLAARLGITERVVFTGFRENPWNVMALADLFVLPSLTEGFPGVIGEAMALGVPVLATRCSPGVEEYLHRGECGMLVEPADPDALARALDELAGSPALRRRLSEEGLARSEGLSVESFVTSYEAALGRVVSH